jgi:lipopolysaccharide/colanic/teichoic acid biosynthesis glycosyltransferase
MSKRFFDILLAGCGLIILSPALLLLAILIKLADGGPVLFRQERVGVGGRLFGIVKFRSMVVNAERLGLSVTAAGDPRITRLGRFLRKTKLDELPQLWNVWRGEMSFVGPRPEVPSYVAKYSEQQKRVLRLKPGITDLATLEFRHEEELLLTVPDPERFYLDYCIPRKIELNLAYAETASLWKDTRIILQTLGLIRTRPVAGRLGKPTSTQPNNSPSL